MMLIDFHKYQSNGNDFILIDDRYSNITECLTKSEIKYLCKRNFGIGADGILILKESINKNCVSEDLKYDFRLLYFNNDGTEAFCCNGSRCAIKYYYSHTPKKNIVIAAYGGLYQSRMLNDEVELEVQVKEIKSIDDDIFVNTGTPHYVKFVEDLSKTDIKNISRKIRNNFKYPTNVTFVELSKNPTMHELANHISEEKKFIIHATTFEKGVEAETLACGTGAVAAAIAYVEKYDLISPITIRMKGGDLIITIDKNGEKYTNIYIKGKTVEIYAGQIDIKCSIGNIVLEK